MLFLRPARQLPELLRPKGVDLQKSVSSGNTGKGKDIHTMEETEVYDSNIDIA